ncbi:MAG: hypothetical protein VB084_16250 [Syntrophomonadaceae bacterium]|nr:hypothetical protein [Syntrophomonadaceae bacterium]
MNSILERMDLHGPGLWLPLAVGAALLLFIILMPKKKMNWRSIYLTFGVVSYVTLMLDVFILGEYLDWFDIGDKYMEGLGDLFTYSIIPSCLAIAYLNYFNLQKKWIYVGIFTIISFLYEWALTHLGYMQLNGWRTWYSLPVYIVVYGLWLPWHFQLMQRIYQQD